MKDVRSEIEKYEQAHFDETMETEQGFPCEPWWDAYLEAEAGGRLHLLTARAGGELVGYHVSFLAPHMHSKSCFCAYVDRYYLAPEWRRGTNGIRLLKEAEKSLAELGIGKIYSGTSAKKDNSRLLEFLGYGMSDVMYSKVLYKKFPRMD